MSLHSSSTLFQVSPLEVFAQSNFIHLPSPPVAQYQPLPNVDSYISTPSPLIIQNQNNTTIEFVIENKTNYTLYNVEIHGFDTAVIFLKLTGLHSIDKLAPHETQRLSATITANPNHNRTTGTSDLYWTVLAQKKDEKTGETTIMESSLFRREMTVVVVPEFNSPLAAIAIIAGAVGVVLMVARVVKKSGILKGY